MFYDQVRSAVALIMLSVSSYTDIKERNIYILPLVYAVIISISIGIAGICLDRSMYIQRDKMIYIQKLMEALVSPLLFSVFICFVIYLSNGAVGMGDALLLSAFSFATGVAPVIRVLCVSILIAGIYAFGLVLMRRRGFDKEMPYAPFLLLAYISYLLYENVFVM